MTNNKADAYLRKEGVKDYQKCLFEQFNEVITTPSVQFDEDGHIIKDCDCRPAVKNEIEKIKEMYGLGIAMLVLHAQQFMSGHIPLKFKDKDEDKDLAVNTDKVKGTNSEQFLYVPVRKYRNDEKKLEELGIVYKYRDKDKYVSHETDGKTCFYCSCNEMNPNEVVIDHNSDELSDDYKLGFTYAPFGRPDQVVHFLAWNTRKENEQVVDMTFGPTTYSDLVQLVIEINDSIHSYFNPRGITDAPAIDGIHNGWAGNTIYHNHYQFFSLENSIPMLSKKNLEEESLPPNNGTVFIAKMNWPLPIYRIKGTVTLNKQAGNAIGIAWKSSSDDKCLYRALRHGFHPEEADYVPVRTQNLFIPGREKGEVGYFIPRDCRKVDAEEQVEGIDPKKNLAVLESIGVIVIDDDEVFGEIKKKDKGKLSIVAKSWLKAIAPEEKTFIKVLSTLELPNK